MKNKPRILPAALLSISAAIIALAATARFAGAGGGPVPTPGLIVVSHTGVFQGNGTSGKPLDLTDSCNPGQILEHGTGSGSGSASAWKCVDAPPTVDITAPNGDLLVSMGGGLVAGYSGSGCTVTGQVMQQIDSAGDVTCAPPLGTGSACTTGFVTALNGYGSATCTLVTPSMVAPGTVITTTMSGVDWVPSGTGGTWPNIGLVYITTTSTTMSGVSSSGIFDGQRVIFVNESGAGFNVINMAAGETVTANKIATQDALTPEQVSNQGFMELQWSAAAGHWLMINFNSGFPTFNTITTSVLTTTGGAMLNSAAVTNALSAWSGAFRADATGVSHGVNGGGVSHWEDQGYNGNVSLGQSVLFHDGKGTAPGTSIWYSDAVHHCIGFGSAGSAGGIGAMPELCDFGSTNPSGTSCSGYNADSIAVGSGTESLCTGGLWEPFASLADTTITAGDIAIGGVSSGTLADYAGSTCTQTPLPQGGTAISASGGLSCTPFAEIDSSASWELAQWDATSGHLNWWAGSACPAGDSVTGLSGSGAPTCVWDLTNNASIGTVPTTIDGSGDLGPSGIHDTGSGASATITFDNGPTGINGYGGIHFENNEEWITTPVNGATTGSLPVSQPYLQVGVWQLNASTSAGEVYALDGVGRPGVQEFLFDATKGGGFDLVRTSNPALRTSAQTTSMEVAGGLVSIGTTTTSTSLYMMLGLSDAVSTTPHGCFWLYDPSNQNSFRSTTGTGTLTAVCSNGSSHTAYDLAGTGTCDGGFARGTASIGAVTFPNTNVFHLAIVESSTEADFYTVVGATKTKVCQITSNLPPTTTGLAAEHVIGSTVTSSATIKLDLDYTDLKWDLTSARSP